MFIITVIKQQYRMQIGHIWLISDLFKGCNGSNADPVYHIGASLMQIKTFTHF